MNPVLHAVAYCLPGAGLTGLAALLWSAGRAAARLPDGPRWARRYARVTVTLLLLSGLGLLATGAAFARVALTG